MFLLSVLEGVGLYGRGGNVTLRHDKCGNGLLSLPLDIDVGVRTHPSAGVKKGLRNVKERL